MKRERRYGRENLDKLGWQKLTQLAKEIFGSVKNATGKIRSDGGTWSYDNLPDLLGGLNPTESDIFITLDHAERVRLHDYGGFGWEITSNDKARIIEFETRAESIVSVHKIPIEEPDPETSLPTVFVGHGRNPDWRDLKDHLHEKHGLPIEAYEIGSRAGHTIRDVLEDMLDGSDLAVLVHTPEDELADGSYNSRPNVIHETGLFQGRLGFPRAIILLKNGATEFSNVAGVQQIRYTSISETYGEVLAWIRRETGPTGAGQATSLRRYDF